MTFHEVENFQSIGEFNFTKLYNISVRSKVKKIYTKFSFKLLRLIAF